MEEYINILNERFSKDSLMSLATVNSNGVPSVRTIDTIYHEGSFYTITYALSNKMKDIENNNIVAISGEWFSAHAIAENLGHIKLDANKKIANKLRNAFSLWYGNGHINEDDINTIILKIKLTDGIIFKDGNKYEF